MKNFSVAKHRLKALVMHVSDSKHKSRLPLSSQTELNFGNKEEESQSDKKDQSSSQTLKEFSVNEAVIDAEIYWVLDVLKITILWIPVAARSPCLFKRLKIVK